MGMVKGGAVLILAGLIAAPAWNAGSYELVTNEDHGDSDVRPFRAWIQSSGGRAGTGAEAIHAAVDVPNNGSMNR
jgi:hypothetical protein